MDRPESGGGGRDRRVPPGPGGLSSREGGSWILGVPNLEVLQARVSVFDPVEYNQYWPYSVTFAGRAYRQYSGGLDMFDVTTLTRYGEQQLNVKKASWGGSAMPEGSYFCFEAITDGRPGEFVLLGTGREPTGKRIPPCRAITDLNYPFLFE
jgi:hypothetical protein